VVLILSTLGILIYVLFFLIGKKWRAGRPEHEAITTPGGGDRARLTITKRMP